MIIFQYDAIDKEEPVILAVVGSRSFCSYDLLDIELKKVMKILTIKEIISGGAAGADSLGIMFARDNNLPYSVYFPDWDKGKGAGLQRNIKLAEKADVVVAFWDGKSRGTSHMIDTSHEMGKIVLVVRIDQQARK